MSSSGKVSAEKTHGSAWTDAEPYFKITPEDIRPPATPEEIAEAEANLPRRYERELPAYWVDPETGREHALRIVVTPITQTEIDECQPSKTPVMSASPKS